MFPPVCAVFRWMEILKNIRQWGWICSLFYGHIIFHFGNMKVKQLSVRITTVVWSVRGSSRHRWSIGVFGSIQCSSLFTGFSTWPNIAIFAHPKRKEVTGRRRWLRQERVLRSNKFIEDAVILIEGMDGQVDFIDNCKWCIFLGSGAGIL